MPKPAPLFVVARIFQDQENGGFWTADIEDHSEGVKHIAQVQGRHRTEEAYNEVRKIAQLFVAAHSLREVVKDHLADLGTPGSPLTKDGRANRIKAARAAIDLSRIS